MMFKLKYFYVVFAISFLISCSSDDMGSSQNNNDYFPLVIDNSWDYKSVTSNGEESQNNDQTMTITNEEMVNDTLFFDATSDENNTNLTTTGILSSGRLFKEAGKFQIKGQFSELVNGLPAGISLPINASVIPIYDKNASSTAELFAETGSFLQDFNGLDLTVDFTLSSQNIGTANTMDVNGTTYDDILSSSVTLTMQINAAPSDLPVTITVLDQQEVLTATHHFANEEGMIKSEITTSFDFEELPNVDLPDVSSNTVQELESSNVVLP